MTLANNLGMDVIAEGVETENQLAHLQEMNCKFGQGYLFSKPVNAQAAGELLRAERKQLPHICAQVKQQEVVDILRSSLVM